MEHLHLTREGLSPLPKPQKKMIRKSWNVVDYDYTQHKNDIDYSEVITEPGLVLSMREIYRRYAAEGIDLLQQEIVPDVEDPNDTDFLDADDNLDVLQHATEVRRRYADAEHSAKRAGKASKKEAGKQDSTKQDEQAKQSEASESKQAES